MHSEEMEPRTASEWLEDIVLGIVNDEKAVRVDVIQGSTATVFTLEVAPEDRGLIIGKRGATAEALRTLVRAAGGRDRKRYILEIIDR